MNGYRITETTRGDSWIDDFTAEHWGSFFVAIHGQLYRPSSLSGFIAEQGEQRLGMISYRIADDECEIVTLGSDRQGIGVGNALVEAVRATAVDAGCNKLWLVTTNDNLQALGFYQRRGFELVRVYPRAVERSRELKPEIPLVAGNGIRIRDELELELLLD